MDDLTQDETYAMQAAGEAAGHNGTSEERWAFRHGWEAGRAYERQQQEMTAADADEQEADARDRYDRAAALGRHLHDYYATEG